MYPVERSGGCRICLDRRSQVCENIEVADTFTIFTTKSTYKINYSFDCNDKCLIYLFNCKTCGKQYTGKITDHFGSSWNNYKSAARKAEKRYHGKCQVKIVTSRSLFTTRSQRGPS